MADKKTRVLIVEDEEVLLQTLQLKLTKVGFDVTVTRDGLQGLAEIHRVLPDIVLLDILMPNLDGFGVLEKLHEEGIIPGLPVIIISNSGQPVEIDRALKLGARDYLVKADFSPDEVLAKMCTVLPDGAMSSSEPNALPVAATTTAPAPHPIVGQAKVLIVEDDQFLRDLMERKLRKEGFVTESAIEGESGLKKVTSFRPDLVLLDIILPGLDGFTILQKIRENSATASTPVILLTNLGQRDDVEKGLKLGAAGYLIKAHFTPGDIVDKVKEILHI